MLLIRKYKRASGKCQLQQRRSPFPAIGWRKANASICYAPPMTIKHIVGRSGAMPLTKRVYTHFDMRHLVDTINTI